jgi:hypothetical protein
MLLEAQKRDLGRDTPTGGRIAGVEPKAAG